MATQFCLPCQFSFPSFVRLIFWWKELGWDIPVTTALVSLYKVQPSYNRKIIVNWDPLFQTIYHFHFPMVKKYLMFT